MFNKLTHKLMDDTFKKSKDGKGYILDIRRPALIRNTTTYEQNEKATFNNINVRTGLGNTVLRRVNFIKGIIQPRTSMIGRGTTQTPMKTLQEMIKEGIKIKYEEPDPWDSAWIDAKNIIVTRMKASGATESEIAEYIIKYPPLNRTQRTRPVTRNPLEDANAPIKDQLSEIGANVNVVNQSVINNTADINKNAANLLTYNGARDLWLQTQLGQLDQLLYNGNQDTTAGRNMLGAKLQQISQQLTFQNAMSQQQIMIGIEALKFDVSLIKNLSINELQDTTYNIPTLALLRHYKIDFKKKPLFEYVDLGNNSFQYEWDRCLELMVNNPNTQLINDMVNKKIYFKEYVKTLPNLTKDEQIVALGNLASIGYTGDIEDLDEKKVETKQAEINLIGTYTDVVEDKVDRESNIQLIIDILKIGIEEAAKLSDANLYEKFIDDAFGANETNKRILKININYMYKKDDATGEYKQSNSDFLKISLLRTTEGAAQYKNTTQFFDYVYNPTIDADNVYFMTSSIFGAKNEGDKNWLLMIKFIKDTIDSSIEQHAQDTQVRDTTKAADVLAEQTRIATEQKDKEDAANLVKIRIATEQKDKEDAARIEEKIKDIDSYIFSIQSDINNPYYTFINDKLQSNITADTTIIIMKFTDKLEYVEHGIFEKYKDDYNIFKNTLEPQVSKADSNLFAIAINTDYDPSFDSADFVKTLNGIVGTGKNKIRAYNKTMSGKGKKENPWMNHIKKFRAANPTLKYSDVLKKAKATYKK